MAVIQDFECYKGEARHFYFGLVPSTLTTRKVSSGASVLPVESAASFASSGNAYVLDPDVGVVTAITYTGVSPTSLTGCSGVPALALGALVTNGTDITGWTVHGTIRNNPGDTGSLIGPSALTHVSEAGGILKFSLASTDTKTTLGVGEFAYDVQRVDSGSEAVLSIGTLTVLQEVLYP